MPGELPEMQREVIIFDVCSRWQHAGNNKRPPSNGQITPRTVARSSGWRQLGNDLSNLVLHSLVDRRSAVRQEEGGAGRQLKVHRAS